MRPPLTWVRLHCMFFFRLLLLNVWRSCDFAVNYLRLLILALIPFLKHIIWYSILFKEIPYGNSFLASLFRISLLECFNVFTTCCHNQYKLVRRKGIQYISNHENRNWMLTPISVPTTPYDNQG